MPSSKQRRDAERMRLQRQLDARREREVARRRFTLIASVVSTLVVVAAIVIIAVVATSGGDSGTQAGASNPPTPPANGECATPAQTVQGGTGSFAGVTVTNATTLSKAPKVSSKPTGSPKKLECGDLVVGTGTAATPTSTVQVHYTGVLYKNGKLFDSSYEHGGTATFSLTGVVPGFTQGIGGHGTVAPMRVGGRRIMILPPSLGYGSQASGSIPANSTLVFVVDLLKVS